VTSIGASSAVAARHFFSSTAAFSSLLVVEEHARVREAEREVLALLEELLVELARRVHVALEAVRVGQVLHEAVVALDLLDRGLEDLDGQIRAGRVVEVEGGEVGGGLGEGGVELEGGLVGLLGAGLVAELLAHHAEVVLALAALLQLHGLLEVLLGLGVLVVLDVGDAALELGGGGAVVGGGGADGRVGGERGRTGRLGRAAGGEGRERKERRSLHRLEHHLELPSDPGRLGGRRAPAAFHRGAQPSPYGLQRLGSPVPYPTPRPAALRSTSPPCSGCSPPPRSRRSPARKAVAPIERRRDGRRRRDRSRSDESSSTSGSTPAAAWAPA
jgi:hypothetical protein